MRSVIRVLIGVLCAAAALLIVLILDGSGIDETAGKAIATAIALSVFGLTGIAGLFLIERRPELGALAGATTLVSVVAFPWVTAALWSGNIGWRGATCITLGALALAQASMLFGSGRPEDGEAVRRLILGTAVAVCALAAMGIVDIVAEDSVFGAKLIAVVAVLYLLGNLLLPLARRSAIADAATGAAVAEAIPAAPAPQELSALDLLRHHGLELVEGPVARSGAHGHGWSASLRGPDGRLYELIEYGAPPAQPGGAESTSAS